MTTILSENEEADLFYALSPHLFCIAGFDGYFKRLNPAWGRTLGVGMEEIEATIGKTLEGIAVSWNAGAERVTGYSCEEMRGAPPFRLGPPGRSTKVEEILTHIRKGEQVEHHKTRWVKKDEEQIGVSLIVSPIRDAGGKIVGASTVRA